MALIQLPSTMPDLLGVHSKPTDTNVVIDKSNKFGQACDFFGIVVHGGLYDVVGEEFFELPNASFQVRDGELCAHYPTATAGDTLTMNRYIPWGDPGNAHEKSFGCRGMRLAKGSNGDQAEWARFHSDEVDNLADSACNLSSGQHFGAEGGPYAISIEFRQANNSVYANASNASVQGEWVDVLATTIGDPDRSNDKYLDGYYHYVEDGSVITDIALAQEANGITYTQRKLLDIGIGAAQTTAYAERAVSACWMFSGFFLKEDWQEFMANPWQVLRPKMPFPYFTPAAAPPAGTRPQGPFSHVFNGPFGGPI